MPFKTENEHLGFAFFLVREGERIRGLCTSGYGFVVLLLAFKERRPFLKAGQVVQILLKRQYI